MGVKTAGPAHLLNHDGLDDRVCPVLCHLSLPTGSLEYIPGFMMIIMRRYLMIHNSMHLKSVLKEKPHTLYAIQPCQITFHKHVIREKWKSCDGGKFL